MFYYKIYWRELSWYECEGVYKLKADVDFVYAIMLILENIKIPYIYLYSIH